MDWTQIVVTLIATIGTVAGLVVTGRFALRQMQAQLDATLELLQTNLAATDAAAKVSESNSAKLDAQAPALAAIPALQETVAAVQETVAEVRQTTVVLQKQSDGILSKFAEQASAARVETEAVKKQAATELGEAFIAVEVARAEGVETGHAAAVVSGVEAGVQQGLQQAAAEARTPTDKDLGPRQPPN